MMEKKSLYLTVCAQVNSQISGTSMNYHNISSYLKMGSIINMASFDQLISFYKEPWISWCHSKPGADLDCVIMYYKLTLFSDHVLFCMLISTYAYSFSAISSFQGTLRVLLVLLHDFPEFLCDYHFSFCDVIPPNCIQMRNLILSAFPRNMRLPDPFTPNLKVL